jgi:ATP-dependent DNA ligase
MGHGRRKGWLSNLHLGARDPESGRYVMLGKTFKGLTDRSAIETDTIQTVWSIFEEKGGVGLGVSIPTLSD